MTYPGYDIARQISGPPVLFDLIVDEEIGTGVVDYDVTWGEEIYEAVFFQLNNCQGSNDGAAHYIQFSTDNGATFDGAASDYRFRNVSVGATQTSLAGPLGLIGMSTNSGTGNAANEFGSWSLLLPRPYVVGRQTVIGWGGHVGNAPTCRSDMTYGYRDADQKTNGIRFKQVGGGLWQNGHCRAVGLRKP